MKTFEAKIEFLDVRVITIEAETLEEAEAKYMDGDWGDETTVDFYSLRELEPLHEVKP